MVPQNAQKNETVVIIECPRCGGHGGSDHWHPDNGVCYLCFGKGSLSVNIDRGERHLAVLRREWKAAKAAGDEGAAEYIAAKGVQKKALVEAAKATLMAAF